MVDSKREQLPEIEERLGFSFRQLDLLEQALTHKSFANEATKEDLVKHNERLEFLGDAILSLIVSEMLMKKCPEVQEGELSRMRATLVNTEELGRQAQRLALGQGLRLGIGEDRSGGRNKPSILADAYEAVLAAAYLDSGLDCARIIVENSLGARIEEVSNNQPQLDPKSLLQEKMQAQGQAPPEYALVATNGPDHRREFQVEARHAGQVIGAGFGHSKKAAEQAAAQHALDALSEQDD